MSILSVDTIQPIGSGSTVTLNSAKIVVGTGITFESNGQAIYAGIITATSFSGSGANLTSLPAQATIANNADNRVITGGSGVNLNGEANLTFDGTELKIGGDSSVAGTFGLEVYNTASNEGTALIAGTQGARLDIMDTGSSERLRISASGAIYFISYKSGDDIIFQNTTGSGTAEVLRVKSDGNVSIADGNLIVANGHGIDFSATSDSGNGTMGNELFDDYEEGSWTPSFSTANSSGTLGSLAYTYQEGRYVKIGSTVYIEGALRTSSVANNGNGTYDIAGLPFTNTSGGTNGTTGIILCGSQFSWTNAPHQFSPLASATYMRARGGISVGDATYTNGYTADFNTSSGSHNRVYFSGTYSVDF